MTRTAQLTGTFVAVAIVALASASIAAEAEWLSLGSKHWAPTVTSKSGIGTASAAVEAKVTREEIMGWCENWSPGDKDCVQRELASDAAKATYRASADCTRGRITAVDGNTYTLAGVWDDSDIGAGRSRWRDTAGIIVGRDNASGGLAISQQWEILCPGAPQDGVSPGAARPAPPGTTTPASAAQFAVGQTVEAKYGREWVLARVDRVIPVAGPGSAKVEYDVRLDNGKRGILPESMLRSAPGK